MKPPCAGRCGRLRKATGMAPPPRDHAGGGDRVSQSDASREGWHGGHQPRPGLPEADLAAPGAAAVDDLGLESTLIVTVKALLQLSPPTQTEGAMPVSARRSVYLIDRCGLLRLP